MRADRTKLLIVSITVNPPSSQSILISISKSPPIPSSVTNPPPEFLSIVMQGVLDAATDNPPSSHHPYAPGARLLLLIGTASPIFCMQQDFKKLEQLKRSTCDKKKFPCREPTPAAVSIPLPAQPKCFPSTKGRAILLIILPSFRCDVTCPDTRCACSHSARYCFAVVHEGWKARCINYFRYVDYSLRKSDVEYCLLNLLILAFPLFVVGTLVVFRLRIVHGPKPPSSVSFNELQHSNLWFSGCCSFRLS